MFRITFLLILSTIALTQVSSEYCYYREAKESKNNYIDCEFIERDEPIEGISLIHLKHNTTIPVIEKGLIAPFKNLKTLYITAANVNRIEPGALNSFKLEMVDLYHNNLKRIENGTFNSLNILKYLDLSYNKFEAIETNTFAGLVSLEWLGLNSNQIKTIGKGAFGQLKKLQALYLHFNRISELDLGAFRGLVRLQLLDLSFNSLSKVESGLFEDQRKLLTLLMKHNALESLPDHLFDNLSSLTSLDVSQNKLSQLQEILFRRTKNLESLKFSSNSMVRFNSSVLLDYVPKLQEVHLYFNQWKCGDLKEILKDFVDKGVSIAVATPVLASSVSGIGCHE